MREMQSARVPDSQVPIEVVGGNTFGIFPKISVAKTYNMYVSDEWLISFPGYKKILEIVNGGSGRGFFHSTRHDLLIAVANSGVYSLSPSLGVQFIGTIDSSNGPVFMDENINNQVCLVDGQSAYIYHIPSNSLTKQTLQYLGNDIAPNYVVYHNTYFLIASVPGTINDQNWYVYQYATNTTISLVTQKAMQNKPDATQAVVRLPGHGNNVLVLGESSSEIWTDVGGDIVYQKAQSVSFESGCISESTIAFNDQFVAFLSTNQNNSPVIRVVEGAQTQIVSDDGLNRFLATMTRPDQSYAMMYSIGSHLFYQLTFYNSKDNTTLLYDFMTKKSFFLTDEKENYHIARYVVYYANQLIFLSITNASLFHLSDDYISYSYSTDASDRGFEIPCFRVTPPIRRQNNERFIIDKTTLWVEQGVSPYYSGLDGEEICNGVMATEDDEIMISETGATMITQGGGCHASINRPAIDLSLSKNGNQSFGKNVRRYMFPQGHYRNQVEWRQLGQANEITFQYRFWGYQRWVVGPGTAMMEMD